MEKEITNKLDAWRYRVLIDHAPQAIVVLDVDTGMFVDTNKHAETLFQLSREELLDIGVVEVSPKIVFGRNAAEYAQERLDNALNGGVQTFEWIHIDSAGTEISCEISLIRLPPYDKKLVRASIIDLTERKEIEEELMERETRLKLALMGTGLGCFDWKPKEDKLHWDTRMDEIFGLTKEDELDRIQYLFSVIHPEDQERVSQSFTHKTSAESEETVFENGYRIIINGETRYVETNGYLIRNEESEILRIIGTCKDVTDRKRADIQLRYQATLLENVSDAVTSVDLEYRILSWNRAAEELYGWKSEEVLGKVLFAILPTRYIQAERSEVMADFLSDGKWKGEVIQSTKGGRELYILSSVSALQDAKGNRIGAIAINRDITEEKTAKRQLRDTRWILEEAERIAHLGSWDWNMITNDLYWSHELYRIFGVEQNGELPSFDDFMGRVHPEDRERFQNSIEKAMAGVNPYAIEFRIFRYSDGEERYVFGKGEVLFNADQKPERLIGSVQDITERKQMEKALRLSDERYRSAIEASPDAFYLLESVRSDKGDIVDFKIVEVNENAVKQMGLPREILIGCLICEMFPVNRTNGFFEQYKIVAETGEALTQDYHIPEQHAASGWYHHTVVKVGDGIANMNRDISERKRAEQALQASEARYRAIAEHFPNGTIALFDTNLRYITVNGAGLAKIGLTSADLEGKRIQDRFPFEIYQKYEPSLLAALDGESRMTIIPYKGGFFRLITLPVKDESGTIIHGMVVSQNITTLKRTEQELKDTLAEFQLAIDTAKLGIWRLNVKSGDLHWNDQLLDIYGLTRDEFNKGVGGWSTQVHPEDQDYADEKFSHIFKGKPVYDIGFRVIRLNGDIRHVNASAAPMYDEQGRLTNLIGINIDISHLKKQQQTLQEREAFLSAIIDNSLNAILVADDKGNYLSANPAAAKMFGYSIQELLQMNVGDLRSSTDPDSAKRYQEYLAKGQEIGEFAFVNPEGETKVTQYHAVRVRDNFNLSIIADITEQKRTEKALRESETRFRTVFNQQFQSMAILSPEGEVLVINNLPFLIQGISSEDFEGKLFWESPAWDDMPEWKDIIKQRVLSCKTMDGPLLVQDRYERSDGSIQYSDVAYSAIHDSDGRLQYVLVQTTDITDRKVAEEKLEYTERRFSRVFYNNITPMLLFDTVTGERLEMNDSYKELFGFTEVEYNESTIYTQNVWVNPAEQKRVLKELREQKAIRDYVGEVYTKTGEIRSLLTNAVMMDIGDSNLAITSFIDITDRKRTEEKLRHAQRDLSEITERFQISTKGAKIGIWDWDVEHNHLIWDDTMFKLYGTSKHAFSGLAEAWNSRIHPSDRQRSITEIKQALKGEQEFDTEFRIVWPDESVRYIRALATVQRNRQGRGVRMVGTNWDITKEKEAERQKMRAKRLELKNKELEQFAYVASHDLQEPLRTVMGFVGLLQRTYQDQLDERAQKHLQFISEATTRMSQLIKALLDYSRIGQDRQLTTVDCSKLVAHILEDLSAQISDNHAVFELDPLPQLLGFEVELRILFQNLISNAIKFKKKESRPVIRISVRKFEEHWEFCVADNGIGIDPKHQKKIFVIFQRLHARNTYEGTGIGLAHCQKIIDLHGGKIWIKSQKGEGSQFYFTIPI